MTALHTIIEIPLAELSISKLNVRRHGGRDVASLARSIATKGLIYPLLVRRQPGEEGYEIVAGKRRYLALMKLDKSGDVEGSVAPCIVLDTADDAAAIELSLVENAERLEMDPLDQYTAFSALVREGRELAEIAHTFSVPVATVRKRLALAALVPEAHTRYRNGEIDDKVLQALTLGSKERQRAYFKLLDDRSAPPAWQTKQWMLGGTLIETRHALFDLKDYPAPIASDLFGDTSYCADADAFWTLQRAAVAAMVADLEAKGWAAVHVVEPGQHFHSYQWEPATKAQGGHVVVVLHPSGEVQVEKGIVSREEARARKRAEAKAAAIGARSVTAPVDGGGAPGTDDGSTDAADTAANGSGAAEMTAALRNYVDLVRHSAVCAGLLRKPKVALRLLAASLIEGARNITITRDRRVAHSPEIAASVAGMGSEAEQERARHAAAAALGLEPERGLFAAAGHVTGDTQALVAKLMEMSDAQVLAVLALIVTESLAVGSRLVDCAGEILAVDVTEHWQADETLLALIRGRAVIEPIAAEVLGPEAPRALTGTVGHAKAVLAESFKRMGASAEGGSPKRAARWQPRWTRFPAGHYISEKTLQAAE